MNHFNALRTQHEPKIEIILNAAYLILMDHKKKKEVEKELRHNKQIAQRGL